MFAVRFLSCFVVLGAAALSTAVLHNILIDPGMDCQASQSRIGRGCSQAMDGRSNAMMTRAGRWESKESAGAWITFNFPMVYKIATVRVMQKFAERAQFKDVDLEFSDGSKQRFTLTKRTGSNYYDETGRWWDDLDIEDVQSSYLTIRTITCYTERYNGFQEVQVIGEQVLGETVPHNILRDSGVQCEASTSRCGRECTQAMDGRSFPMREHEGRWVSQAEGAGAWIMFDFGKPYDINKVRVMQKFSSRAQFKDVDLEFSDGSKQGFTLSQRTGSNIHDENGRWWDELAIQPVTSSSMRIRAISHYTKAYNGFQEVEVIGEPASTPGSTTPTAEDDGGVTSVGCTFMGETHAAGQTWVKILSDGRKLECYCPEPLPTTWSSSTDCRGFCVINAVKHYVGETYLRTINGVDVSCSCTAYDEETCN